MKLNSRLDDVNEDLNLSMRDLETLASHDGTYNPEIAKAMTRVLGSISVTLAMMLDHMQRSQVMVHVPRINREQLQQVLAYARYIQDTPLAGAALRALDGDSLYHDILVERCTAAYARAKSSKEFKCANKKVTK